MGSVVFHLIPTTFKFNGIFAIIIIIRIRFGFMRVTSQILNTSLEKLETRKSRGHSLGFQTAGCVPNFMYTHNINVLYPAMSMSKIFMILHFCLMEDTSC